MKTIAIGIPAYNAEETIDRVLSSINTQSCRDVIKVYIADDNPNGVHYSGMVNCYPKLDIEVLSTTENGGPGVARQRALDAAINEDIPYITFIDADDVLYDQYSVSALLESSLSDPQVVVSQGSFLQRLPNNQFAGRNEPSHPWVFGRLYSVRFLKENNISFSHLRCMEDGEFNAKIRMLIEGTPFKWNIIDRPVYYWNEGSEHSITRTIWKGHNNDIPIYNYGGCSKGAAVCFKQAIDFVAKKNPFNPSIVKSAAELMVDKYFTYYESLQNFPEYAEQNMFIAAWWYNNVFIKYAANVDYETLEQIYMQMLMGKAGMFKSFPDKTFAQWFEVVKTQPSDIETLKEIRSRIPSELLDLEADTGSNELL